LLFFGDSLLLLFGGKEMAIYGNVLKTLSPIPPIVALTFMLGTCTLVAFGHHKEYNQSLIISSIIYLVVVGVLYFSENLSFWNLVYLRVFSDVCLLAIRMFYTIRLRIF